MHQSLVTRIIEATSIARAMVLIELLSTVARWIARPRSLSVLLPAWVISFLMASTEGLALGAHAPALGPGPTEGVIAIVLWHGYLSA